MRGTFGDFSRSVSLLATLTVTGLLTIAAGANLRFAGGIANGMLFLDGSKNASSTSRILVDGNTGSVSSTSYSAGAGAVGTPSINFSGAGEATTGFYIDAGGRMAVAVDGALEATWYSTHFEVNDDILPASSNALDLGSSVRLFRDGWFGGTVSSTNFEIGTAGGAYRSLITGSPTAPAFCFNDGTDGCNDGIYQHSVDGIAFSTNGAIAMRITSNGSLQLNNSITPITNGVPDIGASTINFNNFYHTGFASSTNYGTEDSTATTSTNRFTNDGLTKPTCHVSGRVGGTPIYWWFDVSGGMATSSSPCF